MCAKRFIEILPEHKARNPLHDEPRLFVSCSTIIGVNGGPSTVHTLEPHVVSSVNHKINNQTTFQRLALNCKRVESSSCLSVSWDCPA